MASGATFAGSLPARTRSAAHFASTSFIIGSPQPVVEQAALSLSAKQPQPISDESPTRPGVLLSVPPVEVPAAMLPLAIQRDGAHRIVRGRRRGEDLVLLARHFLLLRFLQALDFARDDELLVRAELDAVFLRKRFRALRNQVNVRAFFQHLARRVDRRCGCARRSRRRRRAASVHPSSARPVARGRRG